jgi:4'-phosphopantetheinyl transferase
MKENISLKSCCETWPKLDCLWCSPPSALSASNDQVHIWRIHLDLPSEQIPEMERTLSFDEKLKAKNFYFERHTRRYIACHGSLRKILAKYVSLGPSGLRFTYSHLGKPFLVSDVNMKKVCFNLSHSHKYALCVVTLNLSIGIDLEYMRPAPDMEPMAKHFFSPSEYKTIFSFSPDGRQQAFYDLWTLKEAYLKATGEGLGSLQNVEISFSSEGLPSLVIEEENEHKASNWTMLLLKPANGYTASLAVEGIDTFFYNFYDFFMNNNDFTSRSKE